MPTDTVKALEWLEKAAENDNPTACYVIGYIYVNGDGVPKDEQKGIASLKKAKDLGSEKAADLLKELGAD